MTVIASGRWASGEDWLLTTEPSGATVVTALTVRRQGAVVFAGGMGDPIPPDTQLDYFAGIDTDSQISAVIVRAALPVTTVLLRGSDGSLSEMVMSTDGMPDGLSIGVARLEGPASVDRELAALDANGDQLQVVALPNLAARLLASRGRSGSGFAPSPQEHPRSGAP